MRVSGARTTAQGAAGKRTRSLVSTHKLTGSQTNTGVSEHLQGLHISGRSEIQCVEQKREQKASKVTLRTRSCCLVAHCKREG